MQGPNTEHETPPGVAHLLGYLNFSTSPADPAIFVALNETAVALATALPTFAHKNPALVEPPVAPLGDYLRAELTRLQASTPAFANIEQAQAILAITFDHALAAYQDFHRDLLFHQPAAFCQNPFFVGRMLEAVLLQGRPWNEVDRIIDGAIQSLNDYIGHRPVAVLETRKTEPYAHEWIRPIPYYIRGAGVVAGRYHDVVQQGLRLLEQTDADVLQAAYFDYSRLDELAIDPRAYDFDHPVNKRPNYHFGQWDPHCIDNQGYYRRFVVQQVTLDALMARLHSPSELSREELLFEAGSVLAGTILMAAGISGSGPDTFDSHASLAKLLPKIAQFRDVFYQRLFQRATGQHAKRLKEEARERRQPFGGARQHLNAQLAKRRAAQLCHVHLAQIYARMGYPAAAKREADVVPAAGARLLCQIDCRLTNAHQALSAGRLEDAARELPEIMQSLRRGIECGAIVDPWNMLGFDANFSLFPALENSVRDHRCDELVELIEQICALYSRVWSEAAARDQEALCGEVAQQFHDTARWWHQFAIHEISSLDGFNVLDMYQAAEHVARALALWHRGGAATGDVAFWAPHAEMFDTPKAYALVVEALLDRGDFVAAMALLIHWLGQAERIGLERADSSFTQLAERWMQQLRHTGISGAHGQADAAKTWSLMRKFLDYLEANAETFGRAPQFEIGRNPSQSQADFGPEPSGPAGHEDDEDNMFGAAYEDMVYRDSTNDGVEGETAEGGDVTADELTRESKRLSERLAYLACLGRLWKQVAAGVEFADMHAMNAEQRITAMRRWSEQALVLCEGLSRLLDTVQAHRIPTPSGDHDSMVDYDRRRVVKESLLERIIATNVEVADAVRLLLAAVDAISPRSASQELLPDSVEEDQEAGICIIGAILRRDPGGVRLIWPELIDALQQRPLLYVPISKGGNPRDIVSARIRQRTIQDLLAWLPRLGLLTETCRLIETAREMERRNPVGPGAVTEFDELFKIGYKALVSSLVQSAKAWRQPPQDSGAGQPPRNEDAEDAEDFEEDEPAALQPITLITCLEKLTETLLVSWLAHSRTLRLSVLEKVSGKAEWKKLVTFTENYGADLFTQRFLNMGNIRAILHQGVDAWLKQLEQDRPLEADYKLLDDLESGALEHAFAVEQLTLVLEAVMENYAEYRDYNSTTTQSDRGELLYSLLDFLRLRMAYDRISWNLKPVVWAHEILMRHHEDQAAMSWRRALTERISSEAERYLKQLADLQKKYAMRMPTVADRLAERFVQPLAIDRIRALVEPAIEEARAGGDDHPSFDILEHDTALLTREPSGVGLDLPAWLMALEEEVEHARRPEHEKSDQTLQAIIPYAMMKPEEVDRQLDSWSQGD
jgi:hypothetical protein